MQVATALPDDLVSRRERDQVREAFERNAGAIASFYYLAQYQREQSRTVVER